VDKIKIKKKKWPTNLGAQSELKNRSWAQSGRRKKSQKAEGNKEEKEQREIPMKLRMNDFYY